MHHWVKYCVNWWMKSEVIGRTSFVTDRHTHTCTDGHPILCTHLWIRHSIQGYGGMHDWVKWCINQCRKSEVSTLMTLQARKVIVLTRFCIASLILKLIQGYGGMHHWVKYCVNRCMKSKVITLTRFCIST